jgi:hypothetical protein
MIICGKDAGLFGVHEEWKDKPISNLPSGARLLKLKFRAGKFAQVFIKRDKVASAHRVIADGQALKMVEWPLAMNVEVQSG